MSSPLPVAESGAGSARPRIESVAEALLSEEWPFIIVMDSSASDESIERVTREIEKMGAKSHLSRGKFRTVIGALGEEGLIDQNHLASLDGVEKVVPIMKPYKLASRGFHEEASVIEAGGGSVPKVTICSPHP